MSPRLPFRYLEPVFFSGLLDDPVLSVYVRPLGRSLLMDCGRIHHLAKRVLKSTSALFISHAHMDHFMGIDTFLRTLHVSPRTTDIYGPPGLADKMGCKLAGYDWNLTEPYWGSFRIHEVFPDRIATTLFSGPESFARHSGEERSRGDRIIFRNRFLQVEAETCDHRIPSLIFRISELPSFQVNDGKIEAAGLVKGEWLRVLQRLFAHGELDGESVTVLCRRGNEVVEKTVEDAGMLYESIRGKRPGASIGYVTDIGFSDGNLEQLASLLNGVTLLVCECSFLAADRDKARASAHLCTSDVNFLMDRLRPAFFLPMHLSKSYIHTWERLYGELEAPPGVTLLRLPKLVTPRPLLPCEIPGANPSERGST
jgi:ribonuclease Z